ncbi:putative protein lysine methyltransferase SET6 [Colletotrichum spinosum]|uniref:SET domain-containing protein n=1 Tax=Colletotrichum spinosum TaxID=1347390 RepID=A0A4R8Q653_9PEZI|nr:putative protein lysine methyltransferase SET6 [Colletotrichum spinosum]
MATNITVPLAMFSPMPSLTTDLSLLALEDSDATSPSLTSYPSSSASRPSSASSAPSSCSSLPVGAPASALFEIRDTPTAGRAVFASQNIPASTLLWRADDLTLSTLLREYRREVCGWCFAYDYGRDLTPRDAGVGFAFCSAACRDTWRRETGPLGVQVWTAVEALVKKRSKEDDGLVDVDTVKPSETEIAQGWGDVAAQADLIRAARMAELPPPETQLPEGGKGGATKQQRKAVQKALQQPISPDVLSYCAGGVVSRYINPGKWDNLLSLAVDTTPYRSADDLRAFTRSYLHLLAVLPLPLLPLVTPETLLLMSSRDNHNAFGIRSLEDEGSEFFGYGCWPGASYFNHSCDPDVFKRREGRVWEFRAGRDVASGEELNITYLGGEEKEWDRKKRRATLKRNWGFECACKRCVGEE